MHMRSRTYDKMAMCPLLMDFSSNKIRNDSLYYPAPNEEKILDYVKDTLEGFDYYRTTHPDGLFEFFPFFRHQPTGTYHFLHRETAEHLYSNR